MSERNILLYLVDIREAVIDIQIGLKCVQFQYAYTLFGM